MNLDSGSLSYDPALKERGPEQGLRPSGSDPIRDPLHRLYWLYSVNSEPDRARPDPKGRWRSTELIYCRTEPRRPNRPRDYARADTATTST